jgi:hypothetical protein
VLERPDRSAGAYFGEGDQGSAQADLLAEVHL